MEATKKKPEEAVATKEKATPKKKRVNKTMEAARRLKGSIVVYDEKLLRPCDDYYEEALAGLEIWKAKRAAELEAKRVVTRTRRVNKKMEA
jgi:ribosomal 30S subunit maturation factor RimM